MSMYFGIYLRDNLELNITRKILRIEAPEHNQSKILFKKQSKWYKSCNIQGWNHLIQHWAEIFSSHISYVRKEVGCMWK